MSPDDFDELRRLMDNTSSGHHKKGTGISQRKKSSLEKLNDVESIEDL